MIYYLDESPMTCASYYPDNFIFKWMDSYISLIYNSSVDNKKNIVKRCPCLRSKEYTDVDYLWCTSSLNNYLWVYLLTYSLIAEYEKRFIKFYHHKNTFLKMVKLPSDLTGELTSFPLDNLFLEYLKMGVTDKLDISPVEYFRRLFNDKNLNVISRWTRTDKPFWVK
jgi:hypothetical protein